MRIEKTEKKGDRMKSKDDITYILDINHKFNPAKEELKKKEYIYIEVA